MPAICKLRIDEVCLMNDFTAAAFSVTRIGDDSYIDLKKGDPLDNSPVLVAGPGCRFHSCLLVPDEEKWRLQPAGGHSLFVPRNKLDRVLDILSRHHDAVSVERICGGGYLSELATAIATRGRRTRSFATEIIEKGEADALCRDVVSKS